LSKSVDDAPRFNKYAMVAADILSSEANVVTSFFMYESTKPLTKPTEGRLSKAEISSDIQNIRATDTDETKHEGQSSFEDLKKCNIEKDETTENKPDLFVIEGCVIRKPVSSRKRGSLH
jgi:hypothetical protein